MIADVAVAGQFIFEDPPDPFGGCSDSVVCGAANLLPELPVVVVSLGLLVGFLAFVHL